MAKKKKKRTVVEWVAGVVSMPTYVTGEGAPFRPEALFWMGADGAAIGSTVGKPGEVLGMASESLRATIERPTWGRPHTPERVRVATPELASALRAGHPGLEVVCAATPEIDALFKAMCAHMHENAERKQSYLGLELDPAAIAAFFRAAAGLFRAAPWKVVPGDESLLSVTVERFGLKDAVLSVIGQMGQSFGLVLFSGLEAFEAYLDAADAVDRGEEPAMPPHLALNFERGADVTGALRREIAEQHWEVAGPAAYPRLMAIDEDLVVRPLTADEVTMAEAIALALPKVLVEEKALLAAWNGGEVVSRTLSVHTHAGDVEVSLRAPYTSPKELADYKPPYDVIADLFELAQDEDGIDPDEREPLEDELVRRFAASPEARGLTDIQSCHFVMDFAAEHFGSTIATIDPRELGQIVFEIIPREVSIEASDATWIIEENRAFFAFLEREFGLPQADACLRVLGRDAVKKLETALSDTSKFGMAKQLFMEGRAAGFDMDTQEGIDAWLRVTHVRPLPGSRRPPLSGSPSRPVDKAALRAKKNQRKAARKARKRSR